MLKKSFRHSWQTLTQPSVFIFLLLGVIIIFFTFFTTNNAMEIAISAIASIFIGIGVNNFSSFETTIKDEKELKFKTGHIIRIMELTKKRINRVQQEAAAQAHERIHAELIDLEELLHLHIQLLKHNSPTD